MSIKIFEEINNEIVIPRIILIYQGKSLPFANLSEKII